jgi:1-deoxy-D-xylulose-5-phosphate reductoisomerase
MMLAASPPDMIFPVAHALHYPDAVPLMHMAEDDCSRWPSLEFEIVDPKRYPGFRLCMEAGRRGGTAPAILNAANEVAVAIFLDGGIPFYRIPELVDDALQHLTVEDGRELGLFQEADRRTREYLMQKYAEPSAR